MINDDGLFIIEPKDLREGPFSVAENQLCSYCGCSEAAFVRNRRKELIFETCPICGFEKDYNTDELVN